MGLIWLATLLGGGLYLSGALDSLLADEQARHTLQTILIGVTILTAGSILGWIVLGVVPTAWQDAVQQRIRALPKVGPALAEVIQAVRIYRQRGGAVAMALALSLVGHFCFVLTFYFAAVFFTPADHLPRLACIS